MSIARFRIFGRIDGASEATVTIDRTTGLLAVRPLRRHRVYELPLSFVAEMVLQRVVKAEIIEKKRQKKLARRKTP